MKMAEKPAKKRTRRFINNADRCRLGNLVTSRDAIALGDLQYVYDLDTRLEESQPLCPTETPPDVVTMNSTVELRDPHSGAGRRIRLVYPIDKDIAPNSVSVLEPLGAQLLGARVGDVVDCDGRTVQITRVVFQPEQEGAWHL